MSAWQLATGMRQGARSGRTEPWALVRAVPPAEGSGARRRPARRGTARALSVSTQHWVPCMRTQVARHDWVYDRAGAGIGGSRASGQDHWALLEGWLGTKPTSTSRRLPPPKNDTKCQAAAFQQIEKVL
jgi:hypothetical protein